MPYLPFMMYKYKEWAFKMKNKLYWVTTIVIRERDEINCCHVGDNIWNLHIMCELKPSPSDRHIGLVGT